MNIDHKAIILSLFTAGTLILIPVYPSDKTYAGGDFVKDPMIVRGASETGHLTNDSIAGTIQRFTAYYKKQKEPRIAIFFNRELSDDVTEWKTQSRLVISGEGSITTKTIDHEDKIKTTEVVKGPLSASVQEHSELGGEGKDLPAKDYIWGFEDGFLRLFLRCGAKLIDRNTIMRLTAAGSQKEDKLATPDVRNTEMNALLNKADIFIEILTIKSPASQYGYEFRAIAKEVKTGRIVASSTSLNWKAKKKIKKIVATPSGYDIQEVTSEEEGMPRVEDVAEELAVDLMNSFINY